MVLSVDVVQRTIMRMSVNHENIGKSLGSSIANSGAESLQRLMNLEAVTSQLVILGNGFDLACDLKTRYSDFFDWMFEQRMGPVPETGYTQKERCQVFGALPNLSQTEQQDAENNIFVDYATFKRDCEQVSSVWDWIFAYECESDPLHEWQDVEAVIKKWVLDDEVLSQVEAFRDDGLLRFEMREARKMFDAAPSGKDPKENPKTVSESRVEKGSARDKRRVTRNFAVYMMANGYEMSRKCDVSYVRAFLLSELNKLEQKFVEYLEGIVDEDYQRRAVLLYLDLSFQDISSITGARPNKGNLSDSILSFNYTQPITEDMSEIFNTCRNIHGNMNEGRVIFGIDSLDTSGRGLLNDPMLAAFTKTYRIMKNAHPSPRHIFDNVGAAISKKGCVDVIKIFGHSLGEADYSYFQSIFDQVNLYSSNVVLIFYYISYPGVDAEKYYQAVIKLMSRYAATLNNSAHGKNLIHKLILEDRLSVSELIRKQSCKGMNKREAAKR